MCPVGGFMPGTIAERLAKTKKMNNTPDILKKIVARKREEIAERRARVSQAELVEGLLLALAQVVGDLLADDEGHP